MVCLPPPSGHVHLAASKTNETICQLVSWGRDFPKNGISRKIAVVINRVCRRGQFESKCLPQLPYNAAILDQLPERFFLGRRPTTPPFLFFAA
jgi:hypothetical protein